MLLLTLWDALFLVQSEQWSERGVANIAVDETPELAKWFMRGQAVGSKPIFDGICAMCGTLLYGAIDVSCALSNKSAGPPIHRDGTAVLSADGSVNTNAQPPCTASARKDTNGAPRRG